MRLKLENPRKKLHKTKAINNLSTYLEYTKTHFKYHIIEFILF